MDISASTTFDFGSTEYADLFARAGLTPFQSPAWLAHFYATLAPERDATPLIVTIRDGGALVGIIPLIRRRKAGLRLIEAADLGVSDYAAPVIDPNVSVDAEAVVKALGGFDVLRIRPVRDEHVAAWQNVLGGTAHRLTFSAHASAPTAPFDAWRKAGIDRKLLSQMDRKAKRWRKQHDVKLERLESGIGKAIHDLAAMRAGRFEGDPIQIPAITQFYAAVAADPASGTETWRLSADGETVALLFAITHAGRFHYLLIGADYDAHGRHSPGLHLYDWLMRDWLERGGTHFDFTIGDEPFKPQFGAEPTPMFAIAKGGSTLGRAALAVAKNRLLGEGAA